MYMQRVVIYPQLGKQREMQQLLESWVKTAQGQGRSVGLALRVFAPEGVVFVLNVRLKDLSELEQIRQRNATDSAFQEFVAKMAALSSRPQALELLEVLAPLPS